MTLIDLERDLRELFETKASDSVISSQPEPHVLTRARRRQVGTALTAAVAITVVVASAFGGVRALTNADATRPAVPPAPDSVTGPVLSPKGRIAFVHGSAVYTIRPDGTGMELVSGCPPLPCAALFHPSWSPDGRRIAFSRDDPDDGTTDLWIVNADGSGLSRLTDCPGQTMTGPIQARRPCVDADPTWSPNGTRIAFIRNFRLYTVYADGSGLRELAAGVTGASTPSWSPDGNRITFSQTARRDRIYVINADGSGLVQLTDEPSGSGPGAPKWSPDGSRIAFFSTPRTDGGFVGEVWVMNPDGGEMTRLFQGSCCVEDWNGPVWSPNGKRIAFGLDEGGGGQLIIVQADGSGSIVLTSAEGGISWR